MAKNLKMQYLKIIRAIFVVFTGCLFLFISGTVAPSRASEKAPARTRHLNTSKIKSGLLSQKSKHKSLKPDIKRRKMGPGLRRYVSQKVPGKALSREQPDVVDDKNMVRVILKTSNMTDDFSDRISPYGAKILRKQRNMVIVEVPAKEVEKIVNEIEEIEYARQPREFFPLDEVSEGVHLSGADSFHDNDFKGSGVKVAVIDVGFKGLSEAHLNGDIPYHVKTRDFTGMGLETKYYHGTACAEIVHDMAPHAELHLLKISDEVDEYNAHDYCVDNGIDIISLSIGTFGSGPGDGTGPLDEAYDELRQNGILAVASAGNQAVRNVGSVFIGRHWEGTFNDADNDDIHEFIPGDSDSFINVIGAYPDQDDDGNPLTNEVAIVMRWNDWPNADVDYDVFLYELDDETGEMSADPIAYSNAIQDGSQEPIEIIVVDIPDSEDYTHYYALSVEKTSGTPSGIELELYLGGRSMFIPFYPYSSPIATSSSSLTEPADAQSVLAVGAIDYMDWNTGPQEGFSSQGPTNAWAGSSARTKPDIMGPDGVSTYAYGASEFFGTSAATPHVAGAAALILSMDPNLTPNELQSYIESRAIHMGSTGKNNIYGWGRMDMSYPDFPIVKSHQKISDTEGNFDGTLYYDDNFGSAVTAIGDLDGDGIEDLAVGARGDKDGGNRRGAVWILFMNTDGRVKSHQKVSDTEGNFAGILDNIDNFGNSIACLGDLDGDGIADLAVGAFGDDDGGASKGAVWIIFMDTDGTVKSHQKISDTEGDFTGTLNNWDLFGGSVASIGDLNGDNIEDLAVGAYRDGDLDKGAVWIIFMDTDGTVKSHQKINDTEGNFTGILDSTDYFGQSVTSLGDLDGDGITDLAVGAHGDGDGGGSKGAVWILFMDVDGTVKSHQKISDTEGNFEGKLDTGEKFGCSVAPLGDLNRDGITDLAIGAYGDGAGDSIKGAVWILFMDVDGRVKSHQKISDTEGSFTGVLERMDYFGNAVAPLEDLDGDGTVDLAVGAYGDDDGDIEKGAVWILFLNPFTGDKDNDGISDDWEVANGLDPDDPDDASEDPDNDGYSNVNEFLAEINPNDADSDDDGISDGDEDANANQIQDPGETHALRADTDGDGIQDGTELGLTELVVAPSPLLGTDASIFIPDADPASTTDPLDVDSDGDGISDGDEDINYNGNVDSGESDPNDPLSPNTGSNPTSNTGGGGGGGSGGCFIATTSFL